MTPKDQADMTITTMRIPTTDFLELQKAAKEDDRSMSALMRQLIRNYLESREDR